MPSETEPKRKLMGAALAAKRGKKPISKKVAKIASSMSEKQLRDFAKKPLKGRPQKSRSQMEKGITGGRKHPRRRS